MWNLPVFHDGTPNPSPCNARDLSFDPERFRAAPEMIAWLTSRGVRPILWFGPWVLDALRGEAICLGRHARKRIPYPLRAALVDFTDPAATAWSQGFLQPLLDLGIAGFKLDRGDENVPDRLFLSGSCADGTSYREGHNAYPLWFARAAYSALPTPRTPFSSSWPVGQEARGTWSPGVGTPHRTRRGCGTR